MASDPPPAMLKADNEGEESRPCLEGLQDDVMNAVLSFLVVKEFQQLSLVSRSLCSDVRQSKSCHVVRVHYSLVSFQRLMVQLQCLRELYMTRLSGLNDNVFAILNESAAASTLRKISLNDGYMRTYQPVLLDMPNLTHVKIQGHFNYGSVTTSTKLTHLSINQRNLQDDQLSSAIRGQKNTLQELILHRCLALREPVLELERLEKLVLYDTVVPKQMSCPRLLSLSVRGATLSESSFASMMESLPVLQHLKLERCPGLTTIRIASSTLESLTTRFNPLLSPHKTVYLDCPNLTEWKMGPDCLREVHIVTNHMDKLDLVLQRNLTILDVRMKSLGYLSIAGCHFLQDHNCHIECDHLGTFVSNKFEKCSAEKAR